MRCMPVFVAIALLGCGSEPPPPKREPAADEPTPAVAAPADPPSAPPPPEHDPPPPSSLALTRGLNAFAFDFFDAAELSGNSVVSPLSIAFVLGMLVPGARGPTQREIVERLAPEMDADALTTALGALFRELDGPREHVRFGLGDRLFGRGDLRFEPTYLEQLERTFAAPLDRVDFGNPEAARARINAWVEERTEQRITGLLPPRSIDTTTELVLVNAVYFRADWAAKFSEDATSPGVFHAVAGDREVPKMRMRRSLVALQLGEGDDSTQLVVLPYADDLFAMAIVVPPRGSPALDLDLWSRWLHGAFERDVHLSLPRFTVTTPDAIPLKDPLRELGIRTSWSSDADFGGIAPGIVLDEAYHKALIEVNERGTEAAAATAVTSKRGTKRQPDPLAIDVDRPFYFVVFDTRSELIVFMGRVVDPSM